MEQNGWGRSQVDMVGVSLCRLGKGLGEVEQSRWGGGQVGGVGSCGRGGSGCEGVGSSTLNWSRSEGS